MASDGDSAMGGRLRGWLAAVFARGEAGDAGVTTGIILTVMAVSGAVIATTTLEASWEGADAYEGAAHEAINSISGTLYPRGGVVLEDSDGDEAGDVVSVPLALAPGGGSVELMGAEGSLLVVGYSDDQSREAAVAHELRWLRGEGPAIDDGELVELRVELPPSTGVGAGERFRVEVTGPSGGVLVIERQAPIGITPVMFLH